MRQPQTYKHPIATRSHSLGITLGICTAHSFWHRIWLPSACRLTIIVDNVDQLGGCIEQPEKSGMETISVEILTLL
jgi:hypothetical protein